MALKQAFRFIAVSICIAASAGAFGQEDEVATLDLAAVGEAKEALDEKLLDYRAARFKDVRLVQTDASFRAFCGQINTTNRMGGYSGWRMFILPLGSDPVSGLLDRPTIEGQPTAIGGFFNQYGSKKIEGDPAARLIASYCGERATQIGAADYAEALTYAK